MAKVKRGSSQKRSNASGNKKHHGVHPGSTTQDKGERQRARSQKRGGPGARVVGEKQVPSRKKGDSEKGRNATPEPMAANTGARKRGGSEPDFGAKKPRRVGASSNAKTPRGRARSK